MLKHIIVGSEYHPVKFHGKVKHLIFECNTCSKRFMKLESYVKKQMKKRQNVCCFCSAECRVKYANTPHMNHEEKPKKAGSPFSFLFKKVFSDS